jgi:UDP-N-acetylmuramyl pentapeptide synthase
VLAFGGDAVAFLEVPSGQGIATRFAEDAPAALLALRPQLRSGDVILVKASRSLHAERIVSGLRQGVGDSA